MGVVTHGCCIPAVVRCHLSAGGVAGFKARRQAGKRGEKKRDNNCFKAIMTCSFKSCMFPSRLFPSPLKVRGRLGSLPRQCFNRRNCRCYCRQCCLDQRLQCRLAVVVPTRLASRRRRLDSPCELSLSRLVSRAVVVLTTRRRCCRYDADSDISGRHHCFHSPTASLLLPLLPVAFSPLAGGRHWVGAGGVVVACCWARSSSRRPALAGVFRQLQQRHEQQQQQQPLPLAEGTSTSPLVGSRGPTRAILP